MNHGKNNLLKKNIILSVILFISLIAILNKDATQLIGINYSVAEYKIPLYLKLYNFYGRHLNYDYMVNTITKNSKSDIEKVMTISKWINDNIEKIPDNVDVIDSHPLTIAQRRLGTKEQFSDLLSVMLVYADIDAFMWYPQNDHKNAVTLFKVNGNWSIVDPYYGIVFINNKNNHASITEVVRKGTKNNWTIQTLNKKKVDKNNIVQIFGSKFSSIGEAKKHYINKLKKLPTQVEISNKNRFDLGGRAYTQSPFNRLQFMVHNHLKTGLFSNE